MYIAKSIAVYCVEYNDKAGVLFYKQMLKKVTLYLYSLTTDTLSICKISTVDI